MGLLQPLRVRGIERRISLREGEGAVPGKGAAGVEMRLSERLGSETLYWVAVETIDPHAIAFHEVALRRNLLD